MVVTGWRSHKCNLQGDDDEKNGTQSALEVRWDSRYMLPIDGRALGVIFVALALGALADPSLPSYSEEADTLFDAGQAALALDFAQTLKTSASGTKLQRGIHTIQALSLMPIYYTTGGRRYSDHASWVMTSFAMGLVRRVRCILSSFLKPDPDDAAGGTACVHGQI